MAAWTLNHVGDAAIAVSCEQRIDPVVSARVLAVADGIRSGAVPGVRDVVESYCAVTVHFDLLGTDVDKLWGFMEQIVRDEPRVSDRASTQAHQRRLTVPVCYGGVYGPDLGVVAEYARCTEAQAIELHATETYRVYLLGFLPGFAYMGSVCAPLAAPRRATPRLKVPAGSVGIAGRQTGVYPMTAPGGWQLVGRTPMRTFDLGQDDPFFFRAGDAVRFEPVSEQVFEQLVDG